MGTEELGELLFGMSQRGEESHQQAGLFRGVLVEIPKMKGGKRRGFTTTGGGKGCGGEHRGVCVKGGGGRPACVVR